ncbi:MAG TPA: nickel pincer cofactor biosynthesis protein LarB [Blastocatellia bacterium]|nr:nickel pincer cofactor biosynthesis protein LarB [Blastocatellia bacterium]
MEKTRLRTLLESVAEGSVRIDEALERLEAFPFEDVGFARVDHHRHLRLGAPEVIFGAGKTADQVIKIGERMLERGSNVLVTRTDYPTFDIVHMAMPDAVFHQTAGVITVERHPVERSGCVAVVTAGTTDIPVAEEAAITAETCGAVVERIFDVGVAGLHRLLSEREKISAANAVVVVAGMEGALPSVVGGLVSAPVIAVPTSVGYGASFNGLAALLGMLNSCASNVSVVNIDNGFGGGFVASLINRRIEAARAHASDSPPAATRQGSSQ